MAAQAPTAVFPTKSAGTHQTDDWVGRGISLDALERDRLYLLLLSGMEPRIFERPACILFNIETMISRLYLDKVEYYSVLHSHATFQNIHVVWPSLQDFLSLSVIREYILDNKSTGFVLQ